MPKYIKKTENDKMGRPTIDIDWEEFDKLCAMFATLEEMAGWFNCSEDTIERRVQEKYEETFAEILKRKSGRGKISLRRNQLALSKTNPTMCIWLGKQHLGQRDVQDVDMTHNFAGPATIVFDDNSKKDEEENIEE